MKACQRGFTLIEVMVAIMLMAVVSLIAWRGLDSVTRADSHLQASAGQTETLLRALNQLRLDLDLRATTELIEPLLQDETVKPSDSPPALTLRGADGKGFTLDIIRADPQRNGDLQRVRWWLKGNTLYRAAAPGRSRFPLPAPQDGVALLEQVSELSVRTWEPGKGWKRPAGKRQENPLGLEISLARQTPQGVERYRQVVGPLE